MLCYGVFLFKQKTAYEMRISDWSSDVCSSDLNSSRRSGWRLRCRSRTRLHSPHSPLFPEDFAITEARALPTKPPRLSSSPPKLARVLLPDCPDGTIRWTGCRGSIWPWAAGSRARTTCTKSSASIRRSDEHTSELQSLMRITYAVFCLE